jgi:glycosyltransferase involved in cell wall biosynthesis
MKQPLFRSFFMGGFECSCHRIRSGKRLDLLEATKHSQFSFADYLRLREQGIAVARDGIRWHLIETKPYHYDFSSALPMVRAAQAAGVQVIWDLCHYGWPDDLDLFSTEFINRFRHFAAAFTRLLTSESDETPYLVPINEISFFSWTAGDVGYMYPFARDRGLELKAHLVRASIHAIESIWDVHPGARIVNVEPVINIIAHPQRPQDREYAHNFTLAQYQAWDMLSGRLWPALGGQEKYVDIIGVNYYNINQWIHQGRTIHRGHRLYKPFRRMLQEVYERYERPMIISETGAEGESRTGWLRYVGTEARAAMREGVPLKGICLYPIVNFPGWEDERHCPNGLWDYADETGHREIHEGMAQELQRQQRLFARIRKQDEDAMPKVLPSTAPLKQPRMTVCLYTDSREPSGLGEHMLTLAAELLQNYRILFVCPPTPRGCRILERAAVLGCATFALELDDSARGHNVLAAWLRRMGVEVFHCHAGIGWEGHEGVRTAREAGVPVVLRTEHLPYLLTDPQQQADYRRLLADVDHVICVSAEAHRSHLQAGVPPEQISIVRNGVKTPAVKRNPASVREEFGLPPTAKLLFTAARFSEQKGHRYLLEAAPQVVARVPDAYFILAGEGPLEVELRRQAATLDMDPAHIIFAGWRNDVARLLAAADLFVLPSLFEGLPLVALEALSLGVPVIGTRVCGTSEAVEDGVCGRLVEPGNSAALAAAISEVLRRPSLLKQWRQAGRQRHQQLFSAERMARETAALYEALYARQDEPETKPVRTRKRQPQRHGVRESVR